MKISIITPSLNHGRFIRQTIESVKNQGYKEFEHIVIDGGSQDETHKILKEYPHLIVKIEKDTGAVNAINKGLKLATGQIATWLNSDDYFDENVFGKIVDQFERNNADFVYGNLTFVDIDGKTIFADKTKHLNHNSLINLSPDIRQPSSFFTVELLKKTGYLNEDFRIVFDYDLFIKLAKITAPVYIDENISFYRDYPETLTRKNVRKQAMEIFKAAQLHGGKIISPITKLVLIRLIRGTL